MTPNEKAIVEGMQQMSDALVNMYKEVTQIKQWINATVPHLQGEIKRIDTNIAELTLLGGVEEKKQE